MLSFDVQSAVWLAFGVSMCVVIGCTSIDPNPARSPSQQPPTLTVHPQPQQGQVAQGQTAPLEPVAEKPSPPSSEPVQTEPDSEPEPTPAAPTRFVLIGDSQAQKRFGWALDYLLRHGVESSVVATYAVCASTALSWISGLKHHCGRLERGEDFEAKLNEMDYGANGYIPDSKTPRLLDLLHKHQPDVVLIELGENYKGAHPKNVESLSGDLARRVRCYRAGIVQERACHKALLEGLEVEPETKPVRCLWILPPYTRIKKPIAWLEGYYARIRAGVEPDCEVVDTRWMTCVEGHRDRKVFCDTDESRKLYFNDPRARVWALGVAQEVLKRLDKPSLSKELHDTVWKSWKLDEATGAYGIFPIPGPLRSVHEASRELWERQRTAYAVGRRTAESKTH